MKFQFGKRDFTVVLQGAERLKDLHLQSLRLRAGPSLRSRTTTVFHPERREGSAVTVAPFGKQHFTVVLEGAKRLKDLHLQSLRLRAGPSRSLPSTSVATKGSRTTTVFHPERSEGSVVVVAAALLLSFTLACGKGDTDSATPNAAAQQPQQSGAAVGQGGQAGGGAAGAGRTSPSITLAKSDVAVVAPTTIEDGSAITGDLRPIETIDVRSRIEGDLMNVLVREGQQVSEGQVLARFDASEQESTLKSAEADRESAKADLANTQWTYEQDATLYKAGAIAQRDLKNAEQAVNGSKARLAATEARMRSVSNQSRDTRVVAPAAGVIDKRMVENAAHVAKGAPLFTIVRNGTLELAASVPSRLAGAVRIGQTVRFTADARQFDGRVARVSPTIDPQTRSITVYVEVPNPGGTIRGGTFAVGRVISRTLTNVLAVPTTALHQSAEDGKPFVYRIDGKTVNVAPVQLGAIDERQGFAQVSDGLQSGDRVIVGNVGTLGRGMTVTIAGEEKNGGKRGVTK